jgi:hypothetical protein
LHHNTRRKYLRAAKSAWRAKPSREINGSSPSWVSVAFLTGFESVVQRAVEVLFINGTGDPGFESFQRSQSGRFGELLLRANSSVRIETFDGRVGACAEAHIQAPVIDFIAEWLTGVVTSKARMSV